MHIIVEKFKERRNKKEQVAARERTRAVEVRIEKKEKAGRRNNIVVRGLKLSSRKEIEGVRKLITV